MTPAAFLTVRVARKCVEADGICSVELVALDGAALPPFDAGAHLDVQLPFVRPGLARPYSLCNDPAERHRYLIAVLREPASRGGSAAMHDQVHEGMTLQVSPPRNQFPLVPGATRHRLLAGGIGVTPMLAMAYTLAHQGADFRLHYAARSRARMAFVDRLQQSAFAKRVHLHVDDGEPAQRLDLAAALAAPAAGEHLYVCGPAGFMDAVRAAAQAQGWPASQVHQESFGPAAAPASTGAAGEGGFEVELAHSGRVIVVPAGQTVLAALSAAGVEVASSCEQGVCGTCLTRVVCGTPDHRDQYLTPEEQAANDQFLPCCSRSLSPRLVLDL
ncbi:MAG: PDR/VanB family oxidoreductase [Rubrivivax sp.]|jgi:vanillate O-demethylase ferredoxin subunit|nr:PDR/VanB family oxidoreductase [Rubrivivax sp.]